MEPWLIGVILRPFGALFIFGCIALPIRMALHRFMPDGWLKRLVLRPIGEKAGAYTWKEGRDFPANNIRERRSARAHHQFRSSARV